MSNLKSKIGIDHVWFFFPCSGYGIVLVYKMQFNLIIIVFDIVIIVEDNK